MPQQVIANPCKGICKPDVETGLCIGCYRNTLERNFYWTQMSETEKASVMLLVGIRKHKFGELK